MNSSRRLPAGVVALIGMFILIIDTKTALLGANEGIQICIKSIVPAIFPFLILSQVINSEFCGVNIPLLKPLQKLCGIPVGGEAIFILGLLGGYPVGAQMITNAYEQGSLNADDARRLLGFCSNAGPAFIFGVGSFLFSSGKVLWALWGIHILSAIFVGAILPGKKHCYCKSTKKQAINLPKAIENSTRTMSQICAWVIAFRIIITYLQRWILWAAPNELNAMITGILELANGCDSVKTIPSESARFILFSVFLGFGGICVAMQTVSATNIIGTGSYFPGKVLQGVISFILATLCSEFIYQDNISVLRYSAIGIILLLISGKFLGNIINKKSSSNPRIRVV